MEELLRTNLILTKLTKIWRLSPKRCLTGILVSAGSERFCGSNYKHKRYYHSGDLEHLEDDQLLDGLNGLIDWGESSDKENWRKSEV